MRKFTVVLLIAAMLSIGVAATAGAAGTPGQALPPLVSGFMLQNRSTTNDASVVIDFYNDAGNVVQSTPATIAKNGAKSYYVPNVLNQPDGRYSVVVSSSESLFSLVNEVSAPGSTRNVEGTHEGFSDTDTGTPLYLPWVACQYGGFNSFIAVQNAGSANTDITADFYQSGQSTPFKSYPLTGVKPGESRYLDLRQAPYVNDLPGATATTGFFGVLKLSSTNSVPLAAILNDTDKNGAILRSYKAVRSGATDLIATQVASTYYGYSSGLNFANPNNVVANVNIKYYASGATTPVTTQDVQVAANSTKGLYIPNTPGMPANFNGTAVIHSDQPVMGVSTQVYADPNHPTDFPAVAYNLSPVSEASATLYMPQVARHFSTGYETGYQLWNVGPGDATVTVTFTNPDGTTKWVTTHSIPANTSFAYYLGDSRGDQLGSGFNGSAKLAVTAGTGKLIGIANFVSPSGGDYKRTYTMFHD